MSDRNLNASIKTKFYIYTDLENLVKVKNGKIIKFFKLIKVFVFASSLTSENYEKTVYKLYYIIYEKERLRRFLKF